MTLPPEIQKQIDDACAFYGVELSQAPSHCDCGDVDCVRWNFTLLNRDIHIECVYFSDTQEYSMDYCVRYEGDAEPGPETSIGALLGKLFAVEAEED